MPTKKSIFVSTLFQGDIYFNQFLNLSYITLLSRIEENWRKVGFGLTQLCQLLEK